MSDEDQDLMSIEAAKLYSEDATFQAIADKLEVSKSHAQTLVRRGIELTLKEQGKRNPGEVTQETPTPRTLEEHYPSHTAAYPGQFPQDPRIGSYILETDGIGRRVMLTPADIMIYDIFRGGGFDGDLSAFISDSINFMYNSLRPAER